jgi:chemotaxis response regulator CheB
MTRVLLVGDRAVTLAGLRSHLAKERSLAVVDSAPSGDRVRAAGRRLEPIDVSIFGMRMHGYPPGT